MSKLEGVILDSYIDEFGFDSDLIENILPNEKHDIDELETETEIDWIKNIKVPLLGKEYKKILNEDGGVKKTKAGMKEFVIYLIALNKDIDDLIKSSCELFNKGKIIKCDESKKFIECLQKISRN